MQRAFTCFAAFTGMGMLFAGTLVLTHAEGDEGMFGMVTALIVQEP